MWFNGIGRYVLNQVHGASERDRTLYDNSSPHGVAIAAVSVTSPDDGTRAAGSAELRVVYLATAVDTSCVAVDIDSMDSYSNAATLLRE